MTDLSVVIAARNEEFLARTIEDIMAQSELDTEVIAVLDGYWPDPPIAENDRVTIIHNTVSKGQRASTNQGVRLSSAKYVMKCDAHCAFDKGFDRKLIQDYQEGDTVVPLMYNLHVFNLKCNKCGNEMYQARTPDECPNCKERAGFTKKMVWAPRRGTAQYAMRFDNKLVFQYWKERKLTEEIVETMSFVGACWMTSRERYFDLEGLDEDHGSWGQVGTEVSCKTWLSGGRLVVNRRTWFAHFFRSQFGWPYKITQGQVDRAREYSRDMWFNNRWHKQKYPLKWLVDKFSPVPSWEGFNWNGN